MIYSKHTPQRNRIQGPPQWIKDWNPSTRKFIWTDNEKEAKDFDLCFHDFIRARTGRRVVGVAR